MADYSELKQNIASVIKSNNRREITGQILQNVLNQMVGSLGENYQLAGFAEPTTNPQQPDQTLFYIAEQAGVYTNFDNITLGDGLSFLMWKNSEWTSHTIGVATHSWVDSNYVSKAFLRQIFRVYDADGFEILPNDTTSIADNIKAMVGLWTNQYLSALGLGDDGQTGAQYLTQLGDVEIDSTTLTDGQVLVYDNGLWVNGQAGGVDMSVVWAALAGNTNEQINASHLTTALTGYVTSSSLSTTLADYVTTTALNTALASYASQSWVSQNYVSIAFLNRILRAYDSTDTQVQPNDTTTAIDNLKAMVGLWTEQYLSALGQGNDGGGGGYITTLGQLEDVLLTTPSVGQALVYAEVESGVYKWVNGTAGVDMSSVWTALAGSTNEQIALSHLTTALSGYVTTGGLSTTLTDYVTATALSTTLADYVTATSLSTTLASYATQQWVGQNYISIAFFNRLFAAYDSNNVIINPNDTTTAVDNIKALVGLWTQQYLSALGQGSDGGVVTSLANLTDVDLGSTINNNDVLTYDSSTNKWTNKPAQGGSTVAALGDLTDVGISSLADKDILQYDYTNNVWKNVTLATALSGYATTSQLSSYLPLSGGTISGGINPNSDSSINLGTATAKYHYIYAHRLIRLQSIAKGDTYDSYKLDLPDKSGTIAVTSDIPTNNNQLTNGAGYITNSALNGYATQTWVGQNYLALSGGTITGGQLSIRPTGGGYTDGIRIHARSSDNEWAAVVLCGVENTGDSGTSTNTWFIGASGGDFFIARNGTGQGGSGDTKLKCLSNVWYINDSAIAVTSQIPTNNNQLTNGAGYVTSSGVTSVATGTGLTGGTITSTGTISINSTYQTYISHGESAYNSLSSYLPLTGGTLTGTLNIYASSGRSTMQLTTPAAEPCDLWLGSGGVNRWSLTCRASDESYNFDIYSNTAGAANGGHVIVINSSGYTTFHNSILVNSAVRATKRLTVGYDAGVWDNSRAEFELISEGDVGNDFWLGTNSARKWGISCRSTYEGSALNFYNQNIRQVFQMTQNGDFIANGGVTSLSDERDKIVVGEPTITVEQIAQMPTVLYRWNDGREDKKIHAGTLAQRWEGCLSEVVLKGNDERQTRSFAYGVAALIAATIDARKIVDHDRLLREQAAKISELENKCSFLEREVERLKCA